MVTAGPKDPGREIFIEYIVQAGVAKASVIDAQSGIEASVIGPAGAARDALIDAARRKLAHLLKKQQGG